MDRRKFINAGLLSAGALALLNNNAVAGMLGRQAGYQFTPLRKNMGIFTERGGTIAWLSNKDGIIVVDAEFPDTAPHVIAELQKQSNKPIQWLINTHHHGDHTSGNIAFKGLAKNVAAHANSLANQKAVAAKANNDDKQLYPDTTFTDQWKIKLGDETIHAHYWGAGHTNGDAMIHFENANIVHTGDLVFNRMYPYVDATAGASVKSWSAVLAKAQKQFNKDTLFVFGHAYDPKKVTGTIDDLKAMQNYMDRLIDFVGAQIKAGKTKDEVMAATAIPGVTDWQGDGIKRSLTVAFDELSK